MLDITLLRKDLAAAVAGLEKRKKNQPYLDVSAFTALEAERKTLQTRTEEIRARRNTLNKQIGPLKAKGESVDALMAEVNALKGEQESQSKRLDEIQPELQALLLAVPNLPHASVPLGEDETGNVNVIVWNHVIEAWREPLLKSHLLAVQGTWQRDDDSGGKVQHLVATGFKDLTPLMGRLAQSNSSRDFH